jgi:hypothetical protein
MSEMIRIPVAEPAFTISCQDLSPSDKSQKNVFRYFEIPKECYELIVRRITKAVARDCEIMAVEMAKREPHTTCYRLALEIKNRYHLDKM